ncbi:hypothetical protein [Clostridium sp.]|uniref:hypothetical protein n=1 Tax=Clostridium sp. TaxID=1506 RepID=UPI0026298437|nr:hypothetical protein [Clostridium sp.]
MEKYKKDYKVYYDEIIKKVNKGSKLKGNDRNISEDIYPRTNSRKASYYYNRESIKGNKPSGKIGYINRFIIRLILTFVIFLGAFSLKILENKEAKVLYSKGKEIINKSYGFENIENIENIESVMKSLNINYKELVSNIEEKYEKAINDIKVFKLQD